MTAKPLIVLGPQPETLEEAQERQRKVWQLVEAGEWPRSAGSPREASLHPTYRRGYDDTIAMGAVSVNRTTGHGHECEMVWDEGGHVLLCRWCFMDGT